MAGLSEAEYLRLRRRIRGDYPETEVVSEPERLFEIDKFRRQAGRPATGVGDAVRDVYTRRVNGNGDNDGLFNSSLAEPPRIQSSIPGPSFERPRDPRGPGGALGLDITGGREDMPVPVSESRRSGGDIRFNPRPLFNAVREIGEAFVAPGGGRIGLTTLPSARKSEEIIEAAGATLSAIDSPLLEGNAVIEELSRPTNAAFAAVPGLALGGRSASLPTRFGLEATQSLAGRGAANAAYDALEGQNVAVQAGGSLLAGLLASGSVHVATTRGLKTGRTAIPLGFGIEDVSDDPLRPSIDELKGVLREELGFRESGEAAAQIRAGRAAQFANRSEALAEASRRGLSGAEAERFARDAMSGRLLDDRAARISGDSYRRLMDGVHLAEQSGAIPNHVGVRLATALDKANNGIRLEPAELRLLADYTGDREVVDALIALNGTAAPSRSALNRPSVPRRGPPSVGGSGSATPATSRVPGRSAGGRAAVQSARERAREVARQAQEEAARIARETAERRKNIPKPPSNRGFVPGGRGGGKGAPNLSQIAADARARAWKPVFGPKRPSTIWERFNDYLNIPRSLASSYDMSAPFRQGAILSARNPQEFYSNWKPMGKAFLDEDFANAFNDSLATGQMGIIRQRAGVFRATLDEGAMNQREEAFMSHFASHVPFVDASQRSYVTFLNALRADVFDKHYVRLVESGLKGPELDEAAKDLAKFINWATGRGNISSGEYLNTLNGLFFAPRLLKSRLDVMRSVLPTRLGGNIQNDLVRQIARENVGSWIAQNIAVMGMIRMTTNVLSDGSTASIEIDPRSSDFGKLRIGNTRYDPWAGFQPILRHAVQFATGERKTASGNVIDQNRLDTVFSFGRSKTSPPMGVAIDLASGETMLGEPVETAGERARVLGELVLPLSFQDLIEGYREGGIEGAAATLPALVGFGVTAFSTVSDVRDEVSMERYGVPFDELESAELKRNILSDERVVEKERQETDRRDDFARISDDIRAEQAVADDAYRESYNYAEWKRSTDGRKNQLIGARLVEFGNEPIEKPKDVYEQFINKVNEHKVSATEFDWDEIDAWRATLTPEENAFIDAQSGLRDTDFQFGRRKVLQRLDQEGYFDIRDEVWEAVRSDLGIQFDTIEAYREDFVRAFSTDLQTTAGIPERDAILMAQKAYEELPPVQAWTDISNQIEQKWIESHPELAADAVDFAAIDWTRMRNAELGAIAGR